MRTAPRREGPGDPGSDVGRIRRRATRHEPDAETVLREINGYTVSDRKQVAKYQDLKDDGSTACGGWMYCGVYPSGRPQRRPVAQAGRPGRSWQPFRLGLCLAGQSAHPVQPRVRGPGRQAVVRGQEDGLVGRGSRQMDRHRRARTSCPTAGPTTDRTGAPASARHGRAWRPACRSSWRRTVIASLFVPSGLKDGPLPSHYEPVESPVRNP